MLRWLLSAVRGEGAVAPALRRLEWVSIVVPAAVMVLLLLAAEFAFESAFHNPAGYVITTAIIAVGLYAFAEAIFGIVRRLDAELISQNERLEISARVAAGLSTAAGLRENLQGVVDAVLDSLGVDAGVVCLLDEDADELVLSAERGLPPPLHDAIRRAKVDSDAVGAQVIRSAQPVVIDETAVDERVGELAQAYGFHSVVSIPLVAEGRAVGVLALASSHERAFSHRDVRWLGQLANQVGVAVERAALFAQVVRRNEELNLLNETAAELTKTLDVDAIADIILHRVVASSGATSASLWLNERNRTAPIRTFACLAPPDPEGEAGAGSGDAATAIDVLDRAGLPRASFRLPLRSEEREFGGISIEGVSREAMGAAQLQILEAVADQGGIALARALLHERVREFAIVEERERIAREMHDGLAQVLGYVNTKAFAVRRLLAVGDAGAASTMLSELEEAARDVYADVREGVLALRTAVPGETSLTDAILEYVEHFERMTGLGIELAISDGARRQTLPGVAELQLLRIVQEALSNVRKHAAATRVLIGLETGGDSLHVYVEDDGRGFAVDRVIRKDWPQFGLQTMRERAETLGGKLTVESSLGQGTRVTVLLPLGEAEGAEA